MDDERTVVEVEDIAAMLMLPPGTLVRVAPLPGDDNPPHLLADAPNDKNPATH